MHGVALSGPHRLPRAPSFPGVARRHVLAGGRPRGRRGDTAPTLIISEVAEGSGYNKVVEFYNPT